MMSWFSALNIRWKLQLSFFMVTLVTIVFVRWSGFQELSRLVEITRENQVDSNVINLLDERLSAYLVNSIWQSAIEFLVVFLFVSFLAKLFVAPIVALCEALKTLESGDLTCVVKQLSDDEIGVLERSFNTMLLKLKRIIRNIDQNSSQMAQSAYQVAAISHEITQVSEAENEVAKEVMTDTESLIAVSESVQELALEAMERATQAATDTREGMTFVKGSIERMQATVDDVNNASDQVAALKDAAQQIYDIIGTIRSIAEQTNLLALNAAIEAARAGESGRGFAVVADEVRNLANRTTGSTEEITVIINQVNEQVEQVSESMEAVVQQVGNSQDRSQEAADIIERITVEITSTAESTQKISEVSSAQLNQFQMLQIRLTGLFESVHTNTAKVVSTARIGDDLYKVSESIRETLSQFTFEKEARVQARADEKRVLPRLEHQLRVRFWQAGHQFESICSDLSLSGMKLRLSKELNPEEAIDLEIFLPYEDLREYESQRPISLNADIIWQCIEAGELQSGVKFTAMNKEKEQELERCFQYFHQDSCYAKAS